MLLLLLAPLVKHHNIRVARIPALTCPFGAPGQVFGTVPQNRLSGVRVQPVAAKAWRGLALLPLPECRIRRQTPLYTSSTVPTIVPKMLG